MNGGQLYWDPQDLSMKEGCSFLTLPFHQTIRLNPLRLPSEQESITVILTAKAWSVWTYWRTTGVQPSPSQKFSSPSAHFLQTAILLTRWWAASPHSTWPTGRSTTGWPDSGPSGTPHRARPVGMLTKCIGALDLGSGCLIFITFWTVLWWNVIHPPTLFLCSPFPTLHVLPPF